MWAWASEANSLAVFSKRVRRFEVNKNLPELAVFVSMLGENPTIPPPPAKLPDYSVNFSVACIMLLKLWVYTWFIRQHPCMPRDSGHISYEYIKSNIVDELTFTSRVVAKVIFMN